MGFHLYGETGEAAGMEERFPPSTQSATHLPAAVSTISKAAPYRKPAPRSPPTLEGTCVHAE